MDEFEGWETWLEPAYLLWEPTDFGYERPPYMTLTEKDKPELTPEQELDLMTKEVDESDGFNIDFRSFRCVFNYHPARLNSHQFVDEPETTEDFLTRLAQKALDGHNEEYGTKFEFVKIVRANFHFACAIMYLITFQVKDPYDDKIKNFQARVLHARNIVTNYVFCRPEPNQGDWCRSFQYAKGCENQRDAPFLRFIMGRYKGNSVTIPYFPFNYLM